VSDRDMKDARWEPRPGRALDWFSQCLFWRAPRALARYAGHNVYKIGVWLSA